MANGNNANYERIDTNYEFFPSVRQGYRPTRTFDGDNPTGRTTMGVDLEVQGRNEESGRMEEPDQQPHADLRMYGPGDVTGIDGRQVIRVEPEPNTDTFPPNYLPLVEFDRPDMAWLFSPERANDDDAGKARPWLCLVVVERDDGDVSMEAKGDKPLPALTTPQRLLPPVEEIWAWAHVQVVNLLSTPELDRVFTRSTPQAVCRLLCPRNLDANTSYIAAVVPTFEPGRRIGIGKEPFPDTDDPELEPAWKTDGEGTVTLPVYYEWEFTTGDRGDFESMVRKLEPRNLATDYEIGVREVDMSDPGPIPLEAPEGITRKLGGALQSPSIDPPPYPDIAPDGDDAGKRRDLRDILNDPATAVTDDSSDISVKGPPIYGQWYVPPSHGSPAATSPLPGNGPEPAAVPTEGSSYFTSWFHDLNVNPQYRIPAGYGTGVVRENQERLMEEAWNRFGDLEEANAKTSKHQAGYLVGSHVKDQLDELGSGVAGLASRVQSIDEIDRRIAAARALDDLGIIEGADPVDGSGGGEWEIGTDFGSDIVGGRENRFVEGIEGSDAIVNAAGTDERGAGGGTELVRFRPDGGGSLALDTAEAARFASVVSPTFRRISRPGGKLNRALGLSEPNPSRTLAGTTSDAEGASSLATRFDRTGDGDQLSVETHLEGGAGEPGGQDSTPGSGSAIAASAWRVTEGGEVMDLAEAVEYHDDETATVPRVLLQLESVEEHCETVRSRLSELGDLLAADPSDRRATALRSLVDDEPTVVDHTEAIGRDTFDTLDRRLRDLVAADPAALAEEFTPDEREAVMRDAVEAHDRLVAGVTDVATTIRRGEFEASDLVRRIDQLTTAVDDIERAATRVRDRIDGGLPPGAGTTGRSMQFTSGEFRTGAGTRLSIPDRSVQRTFRQYEPSLEFDPELQLQNITTDLLRGSGETPGVLDAGAWAVEWAGWKVFPGIGDRENPLDRIMAAPEFEWPMYEDLRDLDQQYLLPGVDEIPRETIGALATNPKFIESFMCGLNHEMGRELLWRRYPTDRRGTYFRQFWDYREGAEQKDIERIHEWQQSELGTNDPGDSEGNRVVLIVRGDLLKAYPDTRIYAAKAVKEDRSSTETDARAWDRVPLLEHKRQEALDERQKTDNRDRYEILPHYDEAQLEQWAPKEYIFRGNLEPDVTFFGFEITAAEASGDSTTEAEGEEQGWFFVLEEPIGETRFGLDVPSSGDFAEVPFGVRDGSGNINKMDHDAYNGEAEKGWDGMSWGHLVADESALESKAHIRVGSDRPASGSQPWAVKAGTEWTDNSVPGTQEWNEEDESEWARNSAHLAHITWQQPVRVCIHADDILPTMTEDDGGSPAVTTAVPESWSSALVEEGDGE